MTMTKTPHPPIRFERFIEADRYAQYVNALFGAAIERELGFEPQLQNIPAPPKSGRQIDAERRREAKTMGVKVYFSEQPCRGGHSPVMRYVINCLCVECAKQRSMTQYLNGEQAKRKQKGRRNHARQ